jgi:glucose-1-phosphate cytidylyltransferase
VTTPRTPTIILCGGRGTRIREVSQVVPKPLLPVGGRPILWHVMKIYASHGHTDFVLALGWLGQEIRRFFLHYEALTTDFTVTLGHPPAVEYLEPHPEAGWRVTCIDTGLDALTGTRVRRASRHLPDGPVMVTYGDSVGDVDVAALLDFHRGHGRLATVTAVRPPGRFGELRIGPGGAVTAFEEKPQTSSGAINGGFMVLEREAIDRYIPDGDDVMLEREPLTGLARDGQLVAYEHPGFWQPMDTPREQELLARLWDEGAAPWRTWA